MRISDWSSDVCSSDLLAGCAAVERRYRAAVPPRHPQAVLRPVPDLRRTEGGYAAGAGLRHRRQPLGSPAGVAAELRRGLRGNVQAAVPARRSEEHTSELQSLMRISYAVFCLKKKTYTT